MSSEPVVAPGPQGLRVVAALVRDPFRFCTRTADRYGGLARIGVGHASAYLVTDPKLVHQVLVDHAANYIKGSMLDGVRVALGNGLFTADDPLWRRQRTLMQPAFHADHLRQVERDLHNAVTVAMGRWHCAELFSEPVDLFAEFVEINTQVVLRALLGVDAHRLHPVDAAVSSTAKIDSLVTKVFAGMTRRMWTFFLSPRLRRLVPGDRAYRHSIGQLDQIVFDIVEQRRRRAEPGRDILGLLLQARDEDGQPMSLQQIRDEVFTTLLAGIESTAATLAWTVHRLTSDRQVVEQLRAELACAPGPVIDLAQLPDYTYLEQVVQEGLRLEPAFPMFFRTAVAEDVLGAYDIPTGANIILSPYVSHRDKRYWGSPEDFRPDRFAPQSLRPRQRYAYYPFGLGKRKCIGENLSLTIAKTTLAALVQNFEFTLPEGHRVRPRYAMSLQPRGGLPMVLRAHCS